MRDYVIMAASDRGDREIPADLAALAWVLPDAWQGRPVARSRRHRRRDECVAVDFLALPPCGLTLPSGITFARLLRRCRINSRHAGRQLHACACRCPGPGFGTHGRSIGVCMEAQHPRCRPPATPLRAIDRTDLPSSRQVELRGLVALRWLAICFAADYSSGATASSAGVQAVQTTSGPCSGSALLAGMLRRLLVTGGDFGSWRLAGFGELSASGGIAASAGRAPRGQSGRTQGMVLRPWRR